MQADLRRASLASRGVTDRLAAGLERRTYTLMIVPALATILAVIAFPIVYTLYMSVHDWALTSPRGPEFAGLENYRRLLVVDARFHQAIWRTFYYMVLSVVWPAILGTLAALVFATPFRGRGVVRTVFILPMMATPVAIAMVWQMMFHPSQGVLNYLLGLVGIPPQSWVFSPGSVIPSFAIVETWQWTPFVMLIVLGGLASLPTEPFDAAIVDGAGPFQVFRYVTLPLVWPFIMVAVLIRSIDALKSFDIIYVITQGGPGTASEILNIYLYQQAFTYYQISYASAVVVLFFIIILVMSGLLLALQKRTSWH